MGEYEITPRMEALNQQLDYAEGAMTSIKEDRQQQDGQSGGLGEAIAGLHGLIGLHLKAWGDPPHS